MSSSSAVTNTRETTLIESSQEAKQSHKTLKERFIEGKNYVLAHKGAFSKIGQIGGTAGLVVGGASLLFSGIAANLTVGGIPLGIPLMVAGGILLAGGTILQAMHQMEQEGLTVGEKIKAFFKETLNNLKIGTIAGVGIAAAAAVMPLAKLATIVPIVIKLKKNSKNEEAWKAFIESFSKDSKIRKKLEGTKNLNDFAHKRFLDPVKNTVNSLEGNKNNVKTEKTENAKPTPNDKNDPLVETATQEAVVAVATA